MRKYWKSTAIITVIVLSIGAFYVNSAMSATQYPAFVIKKQSGNVEEIKSLVLEGGYYEGNSLNYTYTHLKINSDGSEYREGSSLIEQLIGQPSPFIKEMQETYRDFMRGKGQNIDSFFENDQFLAYADVKYKFNVSESSDFKFAISIFDKDNGNTASYNIKVPDSSVVDHIFVEDVQMVDNELKMITSNTIRENDKYYNDKHIYTINVSNGKIISNEVIFSIPDSQEELQSDAQLIQTDPKQANEHLVFLKTESKFIPQEESDRIDVLSKKLVSYNLKTKEINTIELSENLKDKQVSFFDGSTIYFTEFSEQKLVVTPLSIENNQAGSEFTIQLSNASSNEEPPIIIVKGSKLYAINQILNLKTKASVAVVNVKTGETLYEGEVVRKNTPESMEEFELFIYQMSVK
ncbi:hypothetical protein [Paenisporosarcina antarctica]|uniref:Uncharacterized protein n=1 Tax=Paenisporosarcina antarctica TaxID=417367 RepID=A0A4V1ANB6_9BACL|nr:hypothetical protein [Paenisporosarcina antarctica]QBP42205.1 hypothetical protein E2636_14065 [Paenisporosarcina antarctica]